MLARIDLNVVDNNIDPLNFMCSMQNIPTSNGTENIAVVTGPNTYMFLTLPEDL